MGSWWGPSSRFVDSRLHAVSSRDAEIISPVSSNKGTNPAVRLSAGALLPSQRPHLLAPSHWGQGSSVWTQGGTRTFSTQWGRKQGSLKGWMAWRRLRPGGHPDRVWRGTASHQASLGLLGCCSCLCVTEWDRVSPGHPLHLPHRCPRWGYTNICPALWQRIHWVTSPMTRGSCSWADTCHHLPSPRKGLWGAVAALGE